ncbi:MAG: VTT domain-containing protein [Candidatus Bathyarchaeia archaeon]
MLDLINVWQDLSWLKQFNDWIKYIALQYGYFGIFIASFIGAASIIVPIPYTVLIFMLGKYLNPFILAFSAGAGASLGEFFGYLLGYYGRAIISEERRRKINYVLRLFSRYGSLAIFIFALTPLPDDLLFIPLGIMHYSFIRAFIPCFLGKMFMSFILAYGGQLSLGFIEMMFGGEEGNLWVMIATTVLLIIIVIAMLKIDWEKVIPLEEKSRGSEGKSES